MVNVITQGGTDPLLVADGERTIVLEGIAFNVPIGFAVALSGLMSLFRNMGVIDSTDRFGVQAEGSQLRIENFDPGVIDSEYVGISASIGNSVISNSGTVSGVYASVNLSGSFQSVINNRGTLTADFQGVLIDDGSVDVRVNNYQTIEATRAGSIGINVADDSFATKLLNLGEILAQGFGIRDFGVASNIHNKGDITADIGVQTRSDARFVNDGVITSTTAALIVNGADANANVTNRGEMIGDLRFDGGADRLGNTGTITGDVDMGAGNDKIQNTGVITGQIMLGDGRDQYNGNTALSAAHVSGGAGKDDLRGGIHDDVLDGGADSDVLRSGDGDDILIGGGDRDVLIGGAGADVFVYREAADSTEVFDVITDFASGEDRVDLSLLFAGAFAFSGEGLVGGGTASVFADLKANANTFLNVDIDGDGYRDMLILLQRSGEVTADDFIL